MNRPAFIALLLVLAARTVLPQQPAQPTANDEAVYKIGENGVKAPIAIHDPEAEFPPDGRAKNINGLCLIGLIVDATGTPQNLKLVRCNDPVFEKNSLDAVAKYRFTPATLKDGTPVAVRITVEINYQRDGAHNPVALVGYKISAPPGITSDSPGTDGVYPLTSSLAPPAITQFSDEGFGNAAFRLADGNACDVVLTVSAKGKPSDISLTKCDKPILERPALASLLKSHYRPGTLNGVAVPVRVLVHLQFDGFAPTK